jgi:IS1 family transposase
VANVLPLAKRVEVIAHLVEGAGIRPTSRLTGVCKQAITALLVSVGAGCDRIHDRLVRDVEARDIQCDEIWSYVRKKQARVTAEDPPEWGDAYTFVAIARVSKLVISYRVGKRDEANTQAFVADLRARLVVVPQLATDGWQPYPAAIATNFAGAVDYAVVQKNYRKGRRSDGQPSDHRYEPPRDPFITRIPVSGAPDMTRASTSHVERQNLTMRMQIRRLTRLCNGFSKKVENHQAAIALHFAYYNFCRVHEALRVTPAMEAGIADHVWTIEEMVALALTEHQSEPPRPRPLRLPDERDGAVTAPARPLPNGRGFLRLVATSSTPQKPEPPGGAHRRQLTLFPDDGA